MSDSRHDEASYTPIPPQPQPMDSSNSQIIAPDHQYQPPPNIGHFVSPPNPPQYAAPVYITQASPAYLSPAYIPMQTGQQVIGTVSVPIWTAFPQVASCSRCRTQGVTNVKYVPGMCTWLSCAGICLIGCYLGCCFIPFCIDSLQDCTHHCTSCGELLGRKNVV